MTSIYALADEGVQHHIQEQTGSYQGNVNFANFSGNNEDEYFSDGITEGNN